MSKPLIVSLSGGKDSTDMLFQLLKRGEPVHSAVCFDTGWEFPGMLDHIALVRRMIAPVPVVTLYPRVDFVTCMSNRPVRPRGKKTGKPRYLGWGWPSPSRRWCTREKATALDTYNRAVGGGIMCVGFAADEAHRCETRNMQDRDNIRFPLIEWGITEAQALANCRARGFDWGGLYNHFSRVSCFCCPLQGLKDLRKLRRHYPDLWATMLKWDAEMPDNRGFHKYSAVRDLEARFTEEDRQGTLAPMWPGDTRGVELEASHA